MFVVLCQLSVTFPLSLFASPACFVPIGTLPHYGIFPHPKAGGVFHFCYSIIQFVEGGAFVMITAVVPSFLLCLDGARSFVLFLECLSHSSIFVVSKLISGAPMDRQRGLGQNSPWLPSPLLLPLSFERPPPSFFPLSRPLITDMLPFREGWAWGFRRWPESFSTKAFSPTVPFCICFFWASFSVLFFFPPLFLWSNH